MAIRNFILRFSYGLLQPKGFAMTDIKIFRKIKCGLLRVFANARNDGKKMSLRVGFARVAIYNFI